MERRVFALHQQPAEIVKLNPRAEEHGEETVPAFDLIVTMFQPKEVLNFFGAELLNDLYKPESIHDLAGGEQHVLKHPELKTPFPINHELVGATVDIHYGVGSMLRLADAKVNNIMADPKMGGSVALKLRIQVIRHDAEEGILYGLQKHEVTITITPPAMPTMDEKGETKQPELADAS